MWTLYDKWFNDIEQILINHFKGSFYLKIGQIVVFSFFCLILISERFTTILWKHNWKKRTKSGANVSWYKFTMVQIHHNPKL